MPNIVKNTTLPNLLDLIAPLYCVGCGAIGSALCERCKNYIIAVHQPVCPQCKSAHPDTAHCPNCPDLPPIYAVGERSGVLDAAIKSYKYQSIRALARELACLLDATLPRNLDTEHPILVPLPTATHHIRARGFDHTRLIARHLARLRSWPMSPLLARAANTVQVGADSHARVSQAASAYTLDPHHTPDLAATYILLDDIWTTGASTRAAVKKLRLAGVSRIKVALLAYSV